VHSAPPRPPSIDRVLNWTAVATLIAEYGREPVLAGVRTVLDSARQAARSGELVDYTEPALASHLAAHLAQHNTPRLKRVFNLTGTVLHTNLGRAPLPEEAVDALVMAARHPCALEYDLETGGRGDRDDLVNDLLCELTGAEAATVVNNNAAAVFLLLNTLAMKKQVIVSRGELVEIGGAFRVPDIMSRAGARLVEVGTTNRTHLRDFADAIGPRSAMLMKVHTSNYAIQGFTASVAEAELAQLAHTHALPFVVDLGSGTLTDLARFGLPREPTPQESLAAGADLVSFSGDKLLGGPQAGVLAGRADLVRRCATHPLYRAFRPGTLVLAALQDVALAYLDRSAGELPFWRMATAGLDGLERRARRMAADHPAVEVVACASAPGGGTLPGVEIPSAGVAVDGDVTEQLRAGSPPVIARVADGRTVLDLRTVEPEDDHVVAAALARLEGVG